MPDRPVAPIQRTSIDQLLEALGTLRLLSDTVAKHDRALSLLADRLERLERRLDAAPG